MPYFTLYIALIKRGIYAQSKYAVRRPTSCIMLYPEVYPFLLLFVAKIKSTISFFFYTRICQNIKCFLPFFTGISKNIIQLHFYRIWMMLSREQKRCVHIFVIDSLILSQGVCVCNLVSTLWHTFFSLIIETSAFSNIV